MCEITIIDPKKYKAHEIAEISSKIYKRMRDGLGLVRVDVNPDGTYDYRVYKATEPDFSTVVDFCDNSMDSYRLIIHGRLGTSGDKQSVAATHPIHIDCKECDVDWVLHNGNVRSGYKDHDTLGREGHHFTTQVDSELIAHAYGEVPDLDTTDKFVSQPAYVLLGESKIYISCSKRYTLAKSVEMARNMRDWTPDTPNANSRRGYSRVFANAQNVADILYDSNETPEEADA